MNNATIIDSRELATILAALRYWQHKTHGAMDRHMIEIAEELGSETGILDDNDIDELCERLNCGDQDEDLFFTLSLAPEGNTTTFTDDLEGIL